ASATQDRRVAALQANDVLTLPSARDDAWVEHGIVAGVAVAMTDGDSLGTFGSQSEDGRGHELVVSDDFGLLQKLECSHREELRVAGAGSDQKDRARHCVAAAAMWL